MSDADHAVEYRAELIEAVASGAEDYLGRDGAPRFWTGSGAVAARIEGPMDLHDAKMLIAARDPITGDPLGRYTPKTGALEFSIAPPKSLSVLAALTKAMGDERTTEVIDEALDAAARAAVATGEDLGVHLSRSHTGTGADRRMVWRHSDGLIAGVFAHQTSQSGDPQKHRHIPFLNRVRRSDGQWASIDTQALFNSKGAMVAIAGAVFNQHVVEELGLVLTDAGEVAGVPDELIKLFSTRNVETQTALDEWVQQREAEGVTLSKRQKLQAAERFATSTRSPRPGLAQESTSQRLARWLAEASAALGVDPAEISLAPSADAVAAQRERLEPWTWPPSRSPAVTDARNRLDEVMASKAVWRRRQVLTEAAKLVPPGADARWAHLLTDDVLGRAVTIIKPVLPPDAPMDQAVDPNGTVYQAPSVWHAEREILAAAAAGLDTGCAVAESYDGWAEDLSEDQEAAVNYICDRGDTIAAVVGAAGTGKTTTMRAAAARWTRAGYKVTGITVAAQAGEILRKEARLAESRTVAGILRGRAGPPPPGVWIVDEAGMVSTVDLAAIVAAAAASGSKIALIGDPKQLPAINAAGMFRLLTERHDAAELDTGWRFAQSWEYDNSRLLAQGDHTAVDTLDEHGRVHAAADWSEVVANVVAHHRHALRSDQSFLATAATRAEVAALNMELRRDLDVGPELLRLHRADLDLATPIAHNDIIVTGRNDPTLLDSAGNAVLNGARWRVLGLHNDHLHVERLDNPAVTALLPQDYINGANPDGRPWVEHAVASTVHRAQGVTVDHSVTVAVAGANRSQVYVGLTRGRNANHVVVTDADDRGQAIAVLRTAMDRLADDVTGIEHAAASPTPSSVPGTSSEFNTWFATVQARFENLDQDLQAASRAADFKYQDRESWPRLWEELTRLEEIQQPPPMTEPQELDIDF